VVGRGSNFILSLPLDLKPANTGCQDGSSQPYPVEEDEKSDCEDTLESHHGQDDNSLGFAQGVLGTSN